MSDPRSHFKYTDCATCLHTPCNRLRLGAVRPGKFVIVHRRHAPDGIDCPFTPQHFEEIRDLLLSTPAYQVTEALELLIIDMSPAEQLTVDQRLYIRDSEDVAGRIDYFRTLWQEAIARMIRVPTTPLADPRLKQWLHSYQTLEFQLKPEERQAQVHTRAVTDDMAAPAQRVELSNPRWEHSDTEKRSERSGRAAHGDTIDLMIDTTGVPQGVEVAFTIYDAVERSGKKIAAVKGRCDGATAAAQWTVQDPGGDFEGEEIALEFDAEYRDRKSELGRIELKIVEFVLSV